MAAPIRPNPSVPNGDPCRSCGSDVILVRREVARALAGPREFIEVRKCTNRGCSTNDPSQRRLGEAP